MKRLYDKDKSYDFIENKDLENFIGEKDVDEKLKDYLKKDGGTVSGSLGVNGNLSAKNQVIHEAGGTGGSTGYVHVATIKVTGNYVNRPISLEVCRRGDGEPTTLNIQFQSAGNVDPGLQSFIATGNRNCKNAFWLYKASSSTWYLIVQKTEAYDGIAIHRLNNSYYGKGIDIAFVDNHYSTLPSGSVQSTLNNFYTTLEVRNLFNTFLTTRKFAVSNANDVFSGTANWSVNVTKSGYTPIAIISIMAQGSLSSFINVYNWFLDGTTARIYARMLWNDFHSGSSAASGSDFKIEFTILFRKNF